MIIMIFFFTELSKNLYKHAKQNKQLNDNPGKKKWTKQSKQKVFFFPHDRINGSQLAKMKKEYSCHAPAIKFIGMKQLV